MWVSLDVYLISVDKSSVVIRNLLSTAGATVHQPNRIIFNFPAGATTMLL